MDKKINEIKGLHFRIATPEEIRNTTSPPLFGGDIKDIDNLNRNSNLNIDQMMSLFATLKKTLPTTKQLLFDKNMASIDDLHLRKPKIHNYNNPTSEKYIEYVIDKCGVSKEKAITLLKENNGCVYSTILINS